jgi:hypothetical protein
MRNQSTPATAFAVPVLAPPHAAGHRRESGSVQLSVVHGFDRVGQPDC